MKTRKLLLTFLNILIFIILIINVTAKDIKEKDKDFVLEDNLMNESLLEIVNSTIYDGAIKYKKSKDKSVALSDDLDIDSNLLGYWYDSETVMKVEIEMMEKYKVWVDCGVVRNPKKYTNYLNKYVVEFDYCEDAELHIGKDSDVWQLNRSIGFISSWTFNAVDLKQGTSNPIDMENRLYNLTNNGVVVNQSGLRGEAFTFDTNTDYLEHASLFDTHYDDFFISTWMKFNNCVGGFTQSVTSKENTGDEHYQIYIKNSTCSFELYTKTGGVQTGTFSSDNAACVVGEWCHIVIGWGATYGVVIYVNGVLSARNGALTTTMASGTHTDFAIGSTAVPGNRRPINGSIDVTTIFQAPLNLTGCTTIGDNCSDTGNDIDYLFQNGTGLEWPFTEDVPAGPPVTINTVNITTKPIYWDDNITCLTNVTNADPINNFTYDWYLNDSVLIKADSQNLTANFTSTGQNVTCRITAFNGTTNDTGIDSVIILGSFLSIVNITDETVASTSLISNYVGEHINNITMAWYKNDSNIFNQTVTGSSGISTLPDTFVELGYVYYSIATSYPYQNLSVSVLQSSNNVTINESLIMNLTPKIAYWDTPQLECNYTVNSSTYEIINWYKNGVFLSNGSIILNNTFYDVNDVITCEVISIMGAINSTTNESLNILGANLSSLVIDNTTNYIYNTTLNCSYVGSHINYVNLSWLVDDVNLYNEVLYGNNNVSILPLQYYTTGNISCNATANPFDNITFSFDETNNVTGLINVTFQNFILTTLSNVSALISYNVTYDFDGGIILNRTWVVEGINEVNNSDSINNSGWNFGDNVTFIIWYTNNQHNYSEQVSINVSLPILLINQTFYVSVLNITNLTTNVTVDAFINTEFSVNVSSTGDVTNAATWYDWFINGVKTIFGWGVNRISVMFESDDIGNNTIQVNASTGFNGTGTVSNTITWYVNVTMPVLEPDSLYPNNVEVYESINIQCKHNYTGHVWWYDIDINVTNSSGDTFWVNTTNGLSKSGRVTFDLTPFNASSNYQVRCRTWNEFFNYSNFTYATDIEKKVKNHIKLYKKLNKPIFEQSINSFSTECDMSYNNKYYITYHWTDVNADGLYEKLKEYNASDSVNKSYYGFNTLYYIPGEISINTGCIINKNTAEPWEFTYCDEDSDSCALQKSYTLQVIER